MGGFELVELFNTVGIPGLILYFIYQSQKREEQMSARISSLEEYQKTRLESLSLQSLMAMKQITEVVTTILSVWKERKCLADRDIEDLKHEQPPTD